MVCISGLSYVVRAVAHFDSSNWHYSVDRACGDTKWIPHGTVLTDWWNTRTDRAVACSWTAVARWARCFTIYSSCVLCVCVFCARVSLLAAVDNHGHDDAELEDHQRPQEADGEDRGGRCDGGGQPRAQRRQLRHDQGNVCCVRARAC